MLLRKLVLILFIFGCLSLAAQEGDSLVFTTYYYDGGAKSSEGYLRKGKPDGYWKSYYRNGNIKAEGNRENFNLSGPWIFYSEEGEKLMEINYEEDLKNGLRKTFIGGNLMKEENFVNDQLQGYTRHYFETGELLREIPFADDKEKGVGYEYDKDGRIITLLTYKNGVLTRQQQINRLDKQQQKQGMWMAFYPSRSVKEEGPYINNLKNGYWKYYLANGNLQRVEKWVMGELMENAQEVAKVEIRREINPNTGKLAFKGSYRNGIAEGVHREFDEEGNVIASKIYENGIVLFEGIIDEEGRKQGPWKEYYPSGELKAEGAYKDNLKVNNWVYYYIDGEVEQEGNYSNGLPNGLWTWFYENGQIWRAEEYFNGYEDGSSIEYSDTGIVIAKGNYVDGRREGDWFFQVNDHREEGKFFDGLRSGRWVHYYLDINQVRFEGNYENDLESGMHIYYYDNGQVERRGNYIGGKKHGIWEYFTPEGEKIISIEYEDGREIKYNGERIKYGRKLDRELAQEQEDVDG